MLLHKSVEFDSRVRREAEALSEAGHDVTILELAPLPSGSESLEGVRRRSVLPPPAVKRLPAVVYRMVFAAAFVLALRSERPHVVHAHDAAMLLPGFAGARLTRARLVYDSHELATGVPYRDRLWSAFVRAIERLVVPRCDAVITVSEGIADRLADLYPMQERAVVLRNVSALRTTGPQVGQDLRARLGIGEDPLVLHQGAAAPGRGCETLIRAMKQIDPSAHLAFLGDGHAAFVSRLRALVDQEKLRHRIHFVPNVPVADLLSHTAAADVGVALLEDTCDNHRLALPNKLFEYVAAEVPVVVSDLPEMAAVVRRWDIGWVADTRDAASLAAALRSALESRGDVGLAGRLRAAADELSWSTERRSLLAIYSRFA